MRWLVLLFFSLSFVSANDGLTLEMALQKVRQNNLEIFAATLDEEIASLEHEIAKNSSFGSLDLTQNALRSNDALSVFGFKLQSREATFGDFGFSPSVPLNPSTQPIDLNYPQARNHFQTTLAYTVPLYSGGQMQAYETITRSLKVLKTLEKEQLQAQKIFEVKKSFYTLSLLSKHLEQLRLIDENVVKIEQLTTALHHEGYAKKIDILEVRVRKSDIERLIHQAQSNQKILLHFLSFLLNEKVTAIALVEEDVMMVNSSEKELLTRNHDIQKAYRGVEISQAQMAMAQGAFLPKVGAFAQYGSSDNQFLNDFSEKDSYTLGLQLTWNLFRAGSDKVGLEKARVAFLKAKTHLSLAEQATFLKWERMVTQIEQESYEIEHLKKEYELSHAIYENYVQRYAEKLVSIHDVLMKQSDAIGKLLKLREAQNSRNEKIFELETLITKEIA
jgi:outer membrane protein